MRRADIKAGEVYAYCEGRPRSLLHASFTPYFILDNRYYTLGSDGQITLAPAGARPHASRHRLTRAGLPAIAIAENFGLSCEQVAAELRERNDLADFHDQQLVITWAGQTFGRCHLIPPAYLHGGYAEVLAAQRAAEEQEKEALAGRFASLGIEVDVWPEVDRDLSELDLTRKIMLNIENARTLLDIAEGQAAACAGYEPAPGSPELT
jgi:hypothetical protein